MKSCALAFLAILLLGLPAIAQPKPSPERLSLVGTWTGQRERMSKAEGYREGLSTLVITEQKGRAFKGHLIRANKEGDVKEELWGAFTPGGRLMVASDDEGYYSFSLLNNTTLDYCYSEAGSAARTTCARLTRKR
ncbi:MAG: hypothetical protein ABWY35_01085 [Pseudorhodoplanes sp.]